MRARPRRPSLLALATLCTSTALVLAAQKPTTADVLAAAGDYLRQYSQRLSTVAAEEEYTQREITAGASRRLHSDIVLIGSENGMVTGFRDVFAIDGRHVRARDDRLMKLFQPQTETSQARADALGQDGLRYYLSPNLKALDFPTVALEFLRQDNQAHSEFSLGGVKNQDGVQVATLEFKTGAGGAVLPTPEGSETTGRIWVEVGTGAIRQTELIVGGRSFSFKATTKYALNPTLGLWLPSEVVQTVDVTAGAGGFSNMGAGGNMGSKQSLEGRARYSKFRRN